MILILLHLLTLLLPVSIIGLRGHNYTHAFKNGVLFI